MPVNACCCASVPHGDPIADCFDACGMVNLYTGSTLSIPIAQLPTVTPSTAFTDFQAQIAAKLATFPGFLSYSALSNQWEWGSVSWLSTGSPNDGPGVAGVGGHYRVFARSVCGIGYVEFLVQSSDDNINWSGPASSPGNGYFTHLFYMSTMATTGVPQAYVTGANATNPTCDTLAGNWLQSNNGSVGTPPIVTISGSTSATMTVNY